MKDDIFNMSIDWLVLLNTHLGFYLHTILFPLFVHFFFKNFLVIYMLCVEEYHDLYAELQKKKNDKFIHLLIPSIVILFPLLLSQPIQSILIEISLIITCF